MAPAPLATSEPLPRSLFLVRAGLIGLACLGALLLIVNGVHPVAAVMGIAAVIFQIGVVLATRAVQRRKHRVS